MSEEKIIHTLKGYTLPELKDYFISAGEPMGRVIGETMAVIMVAGNALKIPSGVLEPLRTLTSNIALELAYASGDHRMGLFSTGVVLLIIIMILNYIANFVIRRKVLK